MSLQVRLRHALGERVLELPERAVDSPIFVGRATDAEVQVPSIHVGLRHLVFFVHEGQWVVQAVPGSSATSINGSPLAGARRLLAGDVLTLGAEADAPTIEVGRAVVAPTPAVAGERGGYGAAGASGDHAAGGYDLAPGAPEAATVGIEPGHDAAGYAPGAAENDDHAAVGWVADASPRRHAAPRRRNNSSDAAVAFAVVASLAIVVAAGVFIYLRRQKPVTPPAPVPVAVTPKKPTASVGPSVSVGPSASKPDPRNIFNDRPAKPAAPRDDARRPPPPPPDPTDDPSAAPLVVVRKAGPATKANPAGEPTPGSAKAPGVSPAAAAPAADASPESERAFKRVEGAYYDPNLSKALMTFDAYAQEFPDAHKREIEQYREDILDKLWWDRIADLVQKRQDLAAAIKKTEQDIKDETEAAYKKTVLEPKLENQKLRLAAAGQRLSRDMGYKLTTPPPIGKDAEMRALREQRDVVIYGAWKDRVLKHLRETHGSFPWANER